MTKDFNNIAMALAGIFAASYLTDQLATTGSCDQRAFNSAMHALLTIDAPHIHDIYGDNDLLKIGLAELIRVFTSSLNKGNTNISRYVISAIHLEKKLGEDSSLKNKIQRGIIQGQNSAKTLAPTDDRVIHQLASVYRQSFGQLKFRIAIHGKKDFLHNELIMAKCRTLLFTAIRCAVLWRQVGGSRWQLFLQRSKLRHIAEDLSQRLR